MRIPQLSAIGILFAACIGHAWADQTEIVSNATWLTSATAPADGWNSDLNFDTTGWVNAFKSPSGNNIWIDSNKSGQAPNQAWFRQTFTLSAPVTSAVVDVFFDDHGEAYLNGHELVDYPSGGSKDFPGIVVDSSWFNAGENLLAIHGVDIEGPYNNVAMDLVVNTVPEPATALLVLPLGVLVLARRRGRAVRGERL